MPWTHGARSRNHWAEQVRNSHVNVSLPNPCDKAALVTGPKFLNATLTLAGDPALADEGGLAAWPNA